MSYTYLQEQGEAYSAGCCSDIPAYARLRLSRIAVTSCCYGNETVSCLDSQSGTTCARSTGGRGAASSMSSAEDSLAKTSASAVKARELREHGRGYGLRWPESSVRFCPHMSLWKMSPCLFPEDLTLCSVILPKWGTMRNGVLSVRMPWGFRIIEPGYGWLPTPMKSMATRGVCWKRAENGNPGGNLDDVLAQKLVMTGVRRIKGLRVSASFVTLLMGWPQRWASLRHLETDRCRKWLRLHGGC